MDHMEIRRKLPAYLEDDVSAEEKLEIKRHLGSCGICRGALADLELTMWHLKRLPEVEPPPWLSDKILAKVRTSAESKPGLWRRLFSPLRVKLPIVVLVLLLLCGIGYFIYRTLWREVSHPAPSPVLRETAPRPALPTAGPSGAPTPLRTPPRVLTPAPPSAPGAVPPSGVEEPLPPPAPTPSHAPKSAQPPPPALPEGPELRPAEEQALPGGEAVQPFGREEQGASRGGEMEKHPQGE